MEIAVDAFDDKLANRTTLCQRKGCFPLVIFAELECLQWWRERRWDACVRVATKFS
jgi:hypothetical protein